MTTEGENRPTFLAGGVQGTVVANMPAIGCERLSFMTFCHPLDQT